MTYPKCRWAIFAALIVGLFDVWFALVILWFWFLGWIAFNIVRRFW